MKFFISFAFSLFMSLNSYCQQDEYTIWYNKMKNNNHLKEMIKVNENIRIKLFNNYYGNDLQLLEKIDKNCFKTEIELTNCLKSLGFKKAEDYSKNMFLGTTLWSSFLKQNPGFYDLEKDVRYKLLKQFATDNFSPQIFM